DPQTGLVWADGEPGNYINPTPAAPPGGRQQLLPAPGTAPNDPFRGRPQPQPQPTPPPKPQSHGSLNTPQTERAAAMVGPVDSADPSGLNPRIGPQPMRLSVAPGQEKLWTIVGMDLDGLTTNQLMLHFDPRTLDVSEVIFGQAMQIDVKTPPVATI